MENMLLETESLVMGRHIISSLEIIQLVPNKSIEMINNSGSIAYRALYQLLSESDNETEVICTLQFSLKSFSIDLDRPAVEAIAEERMRSNMESLRDLLHA